MWFVFLLLSSKRILVSGEKNIVTLEAANYAAFYIYVIKFLSKQNDKNLITFPTDDKNIVTYDFIEGSRRLFIKLTGRIIE